MAAKAETVGVLKARLDAVSLFVLAVLAGALISLGATASSLAVGALALATAYGPVAALLGLTGPQPMVLLALAFITALYVAATEVTKWRFYRVPREMPGATGAEVNHLGQAGSPE